MSWFQPGRRMASTRRRFCSSSYAFPRTGGRALSQSVSKVEGTVSKEQFSPPLTWLLLLLAFLSHSFFQWIILLSTCDIYLWCLQFSSAEGQGGKRGSGRAVHDLERFNGNTETGNSIPKLRQEALKHGKSTASKRYQKGN